MSEDRAELPEEDEDNTHAPVNRDADLMGRQGSKIRERLRDIFKDVAQGFQAQASRADDQMDWWDCYDCHLGAKQFYNGTAQIYVPIIHDAVEARATRFVNQLFPPSGRYVEVTPSDGKQPMAILALIEHYIRRAKLKTKVAKPLARNGDIEGQYNLYVDWNSIVRQVVSRETKGPTINMDGTEIPVPGDDIEDIREEEIEDAGPAIEVLHDSDVCVLPATCDSIDEALANGGSVTIVRRWTKERVRKMARDGEIRKADADKLTASMQDAMSGKDGRIRKDAEKELAEAAGIKEKGKFVLVYETWAMLGLSDKGRYDEDGEMRLCRMYFGGDTLQLGCKRNPFWNDKCPLLSEPAVKIAGVFKGKSLIQPVATTQYHANDCANEGADSATYALLPIIATDPEKNPRTNTMILNCAAIWEVDPNSTRFMEFPKLWQDAITLVQADMAQIFQTLTINPSMLPQQTSKSGRGKGRNQAEVALEQSVDLLTTAEQVSVMEEGIFSPLMNRFVDLDHQYRDREMTVRAYGNMGILAKMEEIPPIQMGTKYEFHWLGVENARNAQMMQQQMAWLNVARGLAPQLAAEGKRIQIGSVLEASAMSTFGPRVGATVLIDQRSDLTVDPEIENELLAEGHDVPVHPMDNDPKHIEVHQKWIAESGDPHGVGRVHNQKHMMQQNLKASAMLQQAGGGGAGGSGQPGGPPQPGPRIGAVPGQARPAQGPPGMIHADRMPLAFPRKM